MVWYFQVTMRNTITNTTMFLYSTVRIPVSVVTSFHNYPAGELHVTTEYNWDSFRLLRVVHG